MYSVAVSSERRLGQLIAEQKETVGLNRGGGEKGIGRRGKQCGSKKEPHSAPPTLAEAGIDKKLSSTAQKLAAIPNDEFEGILERIRLNFEPVTYTGLVHALGVRPE